MSGAAKTTFLSHYGRYLIGNTLGLLAGLISFPITTRVLGPTEFGLLSYWEAWILLAAAVMKLGAGDAMMRFYPKEAHEGFLKTYVASYFLVPVALGAGLCVAFSVLLSLSQWHSEVSSRYLAWLALALAMLTVLISHVQWLIGTRELSRLAALVNVSWKWLTVLLTLIAIIYIEASATVAMAARVVASLAIAGVLIAWVRKNFSPSWSDVSWGEVKQGLSYSLPLGIRETSSVLLGFADRVMLQWFTGSFAAVGTYSIGFALASYIDQLVSVAVGQAWTPRANRLYNTSGPEAVRQAKARLLSPITYACVGLASGVLVGGRDFIVLVAGEKHAESSTIFQVASLFFLLNPILNVCGTGLLLERRSWRFLSLTIGSALLGILLNYILIPRYGMLGAALGGSVGQLSLSFFVLAACPVSLRAFPKLQVVLKSLAALASTVALANLSSPLWGSATVTHLVAAAVCVLAGYILPVLILDGEMRRLATSLIRGVHAKK